LARQRTIDVVHAATPPDFSLYAARGLRNRGTATILDHHDLSPELFEAKFGQRTVLHRALLAAERVGFHLADVVISPNESFRRIAIDRGRLAPEDVFVVRNGPDPSVFRPVPPDPAIRGMAAHILGYVGLMGSQDGVLEAIEALGLLARRRSDWHAVFVGEGEVLPEARKLVGELGLQNAVSFLGFVAGRDRLVQVIASCDICLSPEPANPLNNSSTLIKVAEYMAVGRPVVAFRLRETEATADGAAVLASTTDEWVGAIDALLDDPGKRAQMGAEGRERVIGHLSWTHSQPVLLQAYERALERAAHRLRPRQVRPKMVRGA
jgi:glycosyltransferase involved in cell wall biosynthesis